MENIRLSISIFVLGLVLFVNSQELGANEEVIAEPVIDPEITVQTNTEEDQQRWWMKPCYCGVPGKPEDAKRIEGKPKIQGGNYAPMNKYRWQVLVLKNDKVWTGGALINDRHIVTSAYYIKEEDIEKYRVVLNEYNTTDPYDTDTISSTLSNIYIHPEFNSSTWDYDVAVLEMADPIVLSSNSESHISPICLPSKTNKNQFIYGESANASGFGALTTASGAPPSQVLKEVKLDIITNEVCSTHFKGITDRMICAGVPEGGKGPTNYDDGGPLQYESVDGRYTLIGVIAYLGGKNAKGKESIHTRITEVRDWIVGEPTEGAKWCKN